MPVTAIKGQRLMEAGKVGSEMYLLLAGECEVLDANGERLGFLGDSSFFGENPIVEAVTTVGGGGADIRTRTVRTTVESELGFIKKSDVLELCGLFPELEIRLRSFAMAGQRMSKKGRRLERYHQMKTDIVGQSPRGQRAGPDTLYGDQPTWPSRGALKSPPISHRDFAPESESFFSVFGCAADGGSETLELLPETAAGFQTERSALQAPLRVTLRPGQQAATSAELAAVTEQLESCMAQNRIENRMLLDRMDADRAETVAKLAEIANALAALNRQRPANTEPSTMVHTFHCEKQCGFSGDFDTVARHEEQCTAGKS